jgi:hypothetical protein
MIQVGRLLAELDIRPEAENPGKRKKRNIVD